MCENKAMKDLPLLKGRTITTNYALPIDSETKAELRRLKSEHRIDVNAWLRGIIREELPKIRKKLETA